MAPRTPPRVFDLGPYGGAPMVNLATGQVTRRRGKRIVRTPLETAGEFTLPTQGGLRILRGRRTNTMGIRDLVVDRQGRVVANLRTGANPQLRMVGDGPNRRLVVGRAGAPAPGAAPTGGGAGRTLAGVTEDDPTLFKSPNDPVLWTGKGQPRQQTLDTQFGRGNYYVEQAPDGKYVVKRKDTSPYAMYNQYPFIRRYLEGLDTGYNSVQNYLTNTYNPMVTAGSQALTQARLASGNAYNAAIQNYSNAAGNVASAMAPAQVAGMTGGTVQAPNMNALGAAQSMAASANVARNLDAGARTALGGLQAESMGQAFQASALGYGAGLLNQYGQKRQQERLKMDQWIEEQKSAQAKLDLDMARLDQSMINSLIVSGDRAAAREVTQRGQDIQADNAAADDARADASDRGLRPRDLLNKGYRRVPKGAGKGWQSRPGAEQDINGDWWLPPKDGGGGGSGGSGGGSGRTTPVGSEGLTSGFRDGWRGKAGGTLPGGRPDPSNPGKPPSWGDNTPANRAKRIQRAADFIVRNRANFTRNGAFDFAMLTTWLGSTVPEMLPENRKAIIDRVRKAL